MYDGLAVHGLSFVDGSFEDRFDAPTVGIETVPAGVPVPVPPDSPAMRCDIGDRTLLYAVEKPTHWTIAYPGLLEARISMERRSVRISVQPGIDPEYVELMVVGSISALIATLEGDLALHASAVEVGDGVVAIAGASGQGKSTTAAMLSAAGCALFSDDTLRLDLGGTGRPPAARGTLEARLRTNASTVAEVAGASAPTRRTVDGRSALTLPASDRSVAELLAVVLPRPSVDVATVRLESLTGFDAFHELHACQRLIGWRHADVLRQNFAGICELVERVPVMKAHIPWGTNDPVEHGSRLRDLLQSAVEEMGRTPQT